MDPRVTAAVAANGGLITRSQALDLGVSPSEIRSLLRHRRWIAVRRGVYTTTEIWTALGEYVDRPRLVARAVVLSMRRGWVLSHTSAADELGMGVLRPPVPITHITRPGWTNAWTKHGVSHHLAAYRPEQVVEVNGVRVLGAARTAVDIARQYGVRHGLVACDAALRRGVPRSELVAAYEPMDSWPGVRRARTCVALADGGAETALESLGRELVLEAGIGTPETQFPVRTDRGVFWCDLQVGNHIIETDGRIKLTSVANGGVAVDVEQAVWDEKLRERAVRARRLVVSRLVWEDHWGRRRAQAVRRLQDDHAESVRLYGPALDPALARDADELRRRHGHRRPSA